jgi:hypothetical protein
MKQQKERKLYIPSTMKKKRVQIFLARCEKQAYRFTTRYDFAR